MSSQSGVRGALLSGTGVFGAAFGWLLSFKILAHWLGPEGVGLFAQFRQIAQTATLASTYGGTNVFVQGLAVRHDEAARRRFRAVAGKVVFLTGAGVVVLMLTAAPLLARLALSSSEPEVILSLRWLALAVLVNIAATYFTAVLNGYRSFGRLALAQVSGPLLLTLYLVGATNGMPGSRAIVLAIAFVLCFGATALLAMRGAARLPGTTAISRQTSAELQRELGPLLRFAISNLAAAMSTVLALLIVRAWIIEAEGLGFAGLFEAGWTLTFNYTTLLLTACNTVYLPMLSAAVTPSEQKACILKTVYLILGATFLICYGLVIWQVQVLDLLYSPAFKASGAVLSVLAIAVIFRATSWVYGTLMVATRSARAMLASEVALNLGLLATTRYVLDNNPTLAALGWAFVVPHVLYLGFAIEYARANNRLMLRRYIWPLVLLGVLPLAFRSLVQPATDAHSTMGNFPYLAACGLATLAALGAYRRIRHE